MVQFLLPRKGTETQGPRQGCLSVIGFNSSYPARGRKLVTFSNSEAYLFVQFLLPRKGTETIARPASTTPKKIVQFLLPRKGTETMKVIGAIIPCHRFNSSYPARGRKLVDALQHHRDGKPRFNSSYPARGRKPPYKIRRAIPSKFNSSYPARGRKPAEPPSPAARFSVQFLLPRKGTETTEHARKRQDYQRVQFLLPRKGTETSTSNVVAG